MRPKDDILYDSRNTDNWKDPDESRKAFYMQLMIEVLIDIRDLLKNLSAEGTHRAS